MSWPARRRPAGAAAPEPALRPGTVTALTGQARDPERLNLAIDGVFACGIDREVAARVGIRVGEVLDAEQLQALRAADEIAQATNSAIVFLTYRARSEREVRDRLQQKGYSPAAITGAIEKLQGWGYLNDAEFARAWTENRAQHQPRGRRLLAQELRQKGVDRELVAATIDDAAINEVADALALARKRLRPSGDDPAAIQAEKRRLGGYLGRRGYGYDVIRPVLARLFGPDDSADDSIDETADGSTGEE